MSLLASACTPFLSFPASDFVVCDIGVVDAPLTLMRIIHEIYHIKVTVGSYLALPTMTDFNSPSHMSHYKGMCKFLLNSLHRLNIFFRCSSEGCAYICWTVFVGNPLGSRRSSLIEACIAGKLSRLSTLNGAFSVDVVSSRGP